VGQRIGLAGLRLQGRQGFAIPGKDLSPQSSKSTCGKSGRCSSAVIIEGSSITIHDVHAWVLLRRILTAESSRANSPRLANFTVT
jgi:hypothetical protein